MQFPDTPAERRAKIEAAIDKQIGALEHFREGFRCGRCDWWQTDLADWFEPQDRLYFATPDDGGELLPTRVYYKADMERDGSEWTATGIERLQVFVELSDLLPATDVTDLLSDEMRAGYRDMACHDAEEKAAWREECERAADDYYARME